MNRRKLIVEAGKIALLLSGEAMQSGLHFALSLALLHYLSARDYGVFALAMVIGGVALTFVRALASMPGGLFIARHPASSRTRIYEGAFSGLAVAVCLPVMAAVAALFSRWAPDAALSGAAFVGLWCLRYHLGAVQYAYGRRKLAAFGAWVFALAGALLAGYVVWRGEDVLKNIFAALALANLSGVVAMQLALGRLPAVSFGRRARLIYLATWKRLAWSAFTTALANIQGQAVSLLVVGLSGPQAYAPIAAVIALFAPVRIVGASMVNLIQPEMSAALARGERAGALDRMKHWTLLLGVVSLALGAAAGVAAPRLGGQALAGARAPLIALLAFAVYGFSTLSVAPRVMVETLMAFRAGAVITGFSGLVGLCAVALILKFLSPEWALAGSALGEALILLCAWGFVSRKLATPAARAPSPSPARELLEVGNEPC